MNLPLSGIRVVEACQMVSGPLATMLLAEQGAEVTKIEMADGIGDRFRYIAPRHQDMSAAFGSTNRLKRSVVLDIKDERGLSAARDLIAGADVFVQNFRPGAAERMRLGEADLRDLNPDLIYVSISGFGETGPDSDQMVYDFVIQARTGMAALQRAADGAPQLVRNIAIDKATSLTVAQAITAALLKRERGGEASHVRVNMLDVGLWFFWPDGMSANTFLDDVQDQGHFADTYEVRATRDGHMALMANGNRTWPRLCAALNPAWAQDPRFATFEDRAANSAQLSEEVSIALAALTTQEALERLRANDLPGAAVTPLDRVHLDEQAAHLGSLVETDWEAGGRVRQVLPVASFGDQPKPPVGEPPRYGQHTVEILRELGRSDTEIEAMATDGVLGPREGGSR